MATFFSDAFSLDPDSLEAYGAFDVSIINDLPLFIDPFLLFHSENPEYQTLHQAIIKYLVFLRDRASQEPMSKGDLKNWYCFPEVKQNWLGFSLVGNGGSGLGLNFARALHDNLNAIFSNFGREKVTKGSHLEKVCLVAPGVGRDNISDFVTNLIQDFLCRYTEAFATEHLADDQTKLVPVRRAVFNYSTQSWECRRYRLPWYQGDYILLTPKDVLTRDETWISRGDMLSKVQDIPAAIGDTELRASVSNYFEVELARRTLPNKAPSARDRTAAAEATVRKYPALIDHYIRIQEDNGDEAADLSAEKVMITELMFSQRLREILHPLLAETDFYTRQGGTYSESHIRVAYFKHAIEDQGGWRIFYRKDGRPVERESDLQVLFRLVWFGTPSDFGAEANDGRGPVDFKVSRGKHKTLVEMKLAKNNRLEQNLRKQVEIYQQAANAEGALKVIIYFSAEQLARVESILGRVGLSEHKDVVLIDARSDNKPSASKATWSPV